MEATVTTTEATLSAIHESMVQLSMTLGRIAARQENMLVNLKKMTAVLAPNAIAAPAFVPGRVLEQPTTKPSSPSLCLANQVASGGAPNADAVFASTMPARCSTLGSTVNVGNNQAMVVFPTTGTMYPHATTSISAGENTLQGVVGSSVNRSAGCSTNVLSCLQDDPDAHTLGMDIDMYAEVLTHVGGFSLFQEFEQKSAYEVFTDCPLKDVLWYEELANCVVTCIGSHPCSSSRVWILNMNLTGGLKNQHA